MTKPKFFAVDFFCGAGGTTRGLIDAGGYVIAGIDNDPKCRQTFTCNNKNLTLNKAYPEFLEKNIFNKSASSPEGQQSELITALDELIVRHCGANPEIPLLFSVCAPCQPFTTISKAALSSHRLDKRAADKNLLTETIKLIRRYKPDIVLSENVAGISDLKYGGVWERFSRALRRADYTVGTETVCASNFGIPQFRTRSILIAVHSSLLKEEKFEIPKRDMSSDVVTVRDAIGHLPPLKAGDAHPMIANHRTRGLSDLNLRRIASSIPGESNASLRKSRFGDLSLECHRKVAQRLKQPCFTDVYTRMHPDRPSPTITTRCSSITNGRFGHYDQKQLRGISTREAAALQSFPDNYVFYPSDQLEPAAKMIGNAVPPKLARFFATFSVGLISGR